MYSKKTDQKSRIQLHYWDVKKCVVSGKKHKIANGIVTGHPKIADTRCIHIQKQMSHYRFLIIHMLVCFRIVI